MECWDPDGWFNVRQAKILVCLCTFVVSCDGPTAATGNEGVALSPNRTHVHNVDTGEVDPLVMPYPWVQHWKGHLPPVISLKQRFPTPKGFVRLPLKSGSYAHWLRELPIRTDRTAVLDYEGEPLVRPCAAIVLLDVGEDDLQQCADSAIRLHAEYLWHRGMAHKAAYHFTSGDRSTWSDWKQGERFLVAGPVVARFQGPDRSDDHATYRQWLSHLFRYAGTKSLAHDTVAVAERPFEPGDIFVAPGGPGHAVVVLDIAERSDGRKVALMGQGFMPAEDFHVLRDPGRQTVEDVWFILHDGTGAVETPSWRGFARVEARRFYQP